MGCSPPSQLPAQMSMCLKASLQRMASMMMWKIAITRLAVCENHAQSQTCGLDFLEKLYLIFWTGILQLHKPRVMLKPLPRTNSRILYSCIAYICIGRILHSCIGLRSAVACFCVHPSRSLYSCLYRGRHEALLPIVFASSKSCYVQ